MTQATQGYYNAEASAVSGEEISFSFGANWKRFLDGFNEQVLAEACQSFSSFSHFQRLDEHDFLDLGCGSGLSSLVAVTLGARRVVSIDIDPHSLECARYLRSKCGIDESRWEIRPGSVLDPALLESLGRFSYCYSWGVLHHTGSMWPAIANVVQYNTADRGYFHLALYNKHRTSERWLRIKRLCNRSPRFWFPLIRNLFIAGLFGKMLLRGRSPRRYLRDYKSHRGMDFYRDIDDWVGGLPYEYCTPDETVDDLADRGFALLRLRTTTSCGCNEFLFQRQ